MGWTATILVPCSVSLKATTAAEAISVAKQLASQYDKVGKYSAKILEIDPTQPNRLSEGLPPPMAA